MSEPSQSPSRPRPITHRPLLDGTRGVMMCVVLGYHLDGITKLPGAWVSMDFFFVLSGYLITTLLVREYEVGGRLDLRQFYKRRVRRLGPALLVTIAGVLVAAAIIGRNEFPDLRADGLATLFYVANWHFIWSAQSYFAAGDLSPFRHAWSLAIEEQFYLLWPVLFWLLARLTRFDRRKMMAVLGVAAVASMAWMSHLAGGHVDLSRAYYGTDTRGQGLIVGSILALILWHERWDGPRARRTAGWLGTAAFVGLVVMMFAFSDSSRAVYTRGGFLLIAVVSAVFVFGCARAERGPLAWIFGNPLSRHMGAISYCFYLWHWPIIVFLDEQRTGWSGAPLDTVRVVLAVLAAEATYWAIERPIHSRRWELKRQGLVLGGAFVACLGILAAVTAGTVDQRPPTGGSGERASGAVEGPSVLVLGDSLAWLVSGSAPDDLGYRVNGVFRAHCDIIGDRIQAGDVTEDADPKCGEWPQDWAAGLDEHRPEAVLVTLGLRQLFDPVVDGERLPVGSPAWQRAYDAAVRRAVATIRAHTDAPVFWLDVPCYRWAEVGGDGEEQDPERLDIVNRELRRVLADDDGITVVDYRDRVCGGADRTVVDFDLRPDGAHLTEGASQDLWRDLEPLLDEALGR